MPRGIYVRRVNTHCRSGHELILKNVYMRTNGRKACKVCHRAWQSNNKDKRHETWKRYYKRHREKEKARNRVRYYKVTREQFNMWQHRWRKNNPEKVRASREARRARKLSQLGCWPISESDFISLLWETDPNCYYCREPLKGIYHLEHKIPLSRPKECPTGRKLHEPWNLRLSCPPCNEKKGSKTAKEFTEKAGNPSKGK